MLQAMKTTFIVAATFLTLFMLFMFSFREVKAEEPRQSAESICEFKRKNDIIDCDRFFLVFSWTEEDKRECYNDAASAKRLCLDAQRYEDMPSFLY